MLEFVRDVILAVAVLATLVALAATGGNEKPSGHGSAAKARVAAAAPSCPPAHIGKAPTHKL